MMNQVRYKATFELETTSEAAATEFAIGHLKERGYSVTAPNAKWETVGEFNKRLGISKQGVRRALKRAGCPHVIIQLSDGKGPGGKRITGICSNSEFEAFLLKRKNTHNPAV